MTEHKDTKDKGHTSPKDQAAAQTGNPDAKPGEPGHYNPPDPDAGVTHSTSNEVLTPEMIKKAEEIPGSPPEKDSKKT